MLVQLCAWNLSPEGTEILKRISKLFNENSINTKIIDCGVSVYNPDETVISFDKNSDATTADAKQKYVAGPIYKLIKQDKATRASTFEVVQQCVSDCLARETNTNYVEKDNVKVGNDEHADIIINEQEITHLKKIRDFLGGGTVIIKKDNKEIRID